MFHKLSAYEASTKLNQDKKNIQKGSKISFLYYCTYVYVLQTTKEISSTSKSANSFENENEKREMNLPDLSGSAGYPAQ